MHIDLHTTVQLTDNVVIIVNDHKWYNFACVRDRRQLMHRLLLRFIFD